jgi:hypothetical protein
LLQVTENITTPEVSPERLIPLVDYLDAWKGLQNISQWVLNTVEKGYRIQFQYRPPRFSGVTHTLVSPDQDQVMEQEVQSLLARRP